MATNLFSLKQVILVSAFVLFSICAEAQYKNVKVDAMPNRMNIEQVDYYENSTIVCISYQSEEEITWMNIGDKTFARTKNGKKYPMINSINLPISSEAENRNMIFDYVGQKHHFALEFAKLPEGESFDIIENENTPNGFNFYNLSVDTLSKGNLMNLDKFIADYPVKEWGRFLVDGQLISYVKSNGITLTMNIQAIKQYGKYYVVNLNLKNQSGNSILLNVDNITAEGYVVDDNTISKTMPLKVLNSYEYDKIVKKKQNWNNFWVALGEGLAASNAGYSSSTTNYSGSSYTTGSASARGYIGNTYGYASAYGSAYTTTYGQSHTQSYNGAAAYAAQQQANANYNAYANRQAEIREQINAGYIKNNTIRDGVEYSGFINIKYKKIDHIKVVFTINGIQFPFTI